MLELVMKLLGNSNSYRGTCPVCHKHNTFSVTKHNGRVFYHCFSASCSVMGSSKSNYTTSDLNEVMKEYKEGNEEFVLPDRFVSCTSKQEAIDYLRSVNCLIPFENKVAKILFDPKSNRVVFVSEHNHKIVGAIGRAIDKGVTPKWLRYDSNPYPYVCGREKIAFVVEDAASATAISPWVTGIAILGTSFSTNHLSFLKGYDKVYIALDKDATSKSLHIHQVVAFFCDTKVVMLEQDLKYNPRKVKEYVGKQL